MAERGREGEEGEERMNQDRILEGGRDESKLAEREVNEGRSTRENRKGREGG